MSRNRQLRRRCRDRRVSGASISPATASICPTGRTSLRSPNMAGTRSRSGERARADQLHPIMDVSLFDQPATIRTSHRDQIPFLAICDKSGSTRARSRMEAGWRVAAGGIRLYPQTRSQPQMLPVTSQPAARPPIRNLQTLASSRKIGRRNPGRPRRVYLHGVSRETGDRRPRRTGGWGRVGLVG